MKAFDELLEVATRLNSPDGCPWDLKQTFFSLQPYVLEEAHELIEAVDGQKDEEIVEELGDLLYTVIFYAKIAEKEGRFRMEEIINAVKEKLIRRHPHVFGSGSAKTEEEVISAWHKIKQEEVGKQYRKSALDGVPDSLPSIAKAQKMIKVFFRKKFMEQPSIEDLSEEEVGRRLWDVLLQAESSGVDAESALRRTLSLEKKAFSEWESS